MPRYTKGQSGNPAGRPKGIPNKISLVKAIRTCFHQNPELLDEFAQCLIHLASKGNYRAIERVSYALDGPPVPRIAVQDLTDEQILSLLKMPVVTWQDNLEESPELPESPDNCLIYQENQTDLAGSP